MATLGDSVYDAGTPEEYRACYDPSWGRHKTRTRPAPGNHEYLTPGASGYFGYFGAAAGDATKGYYSYDLGAWHIVVLNSVCSAVGGCHAGSPQERWLRNDLAASEASCTAAYWHHPRFSSGPHGSSVEMQAFWQALYDDGAELILSAHDHLYERFAPQTPTGVRDDAHGIRQFTVGTGGRSLYPIGTRAPNSEAAQAGAYGVLKLVLSENGYVSEFLAESGKTFTDFSSGMCHGAPTTVSPPPGPTPPTTPPSDTVAPNTRISSKPASGTRSRSATFRFSSTERGSFFRCKLDSRAWRSCSSPRTYRQLAVGFHTFRVAARDRAGNLDRSAAIWRWRIAHPRVGVLARDR